MKLDKGNSKNHHVIRPRNVDQNKRLLVSSEKEEFSAEMRIPHCASIEVPNIEELLFKRLVKKPFSRPSYYLRYSLLPNDQLENLIDYEITNSDLEWLEKTRQPKALISSSPQSLLEQTFLVWENDTNKGQIIPWERALYLVKEQKIFEDLINDDICKYFESLFKYWIEQRRLIGRPLVRRYWKSEGINDSNVRIAFQPRSNYKERRRLRNSKKNDQEVLDKVKITQAKGLLRHFEMLQSLLKGIYLRESLKKNKSELIKAAFEQERIDKGMKTAPIAVPDSLSFDFSKEFRKNYRFVDSEFLPLPETFVFPPMLEKFESEKPSKRRGPEAPVVRKKDLNFDIARAGCLLIAEGEKLQKWQFIDGNNKPQSEVTGNVNTQLSYERSLKMRGRVSRAGKNIVIDRLSNNEFEHRWGRYLGLRGVWHCFDGESLQDDAENDDLEALSRVQKMIFMNFRPNGNKFKK